MDEDGRSLVVGSQYWGKEGRVTGENGDFAGTHPTTVSPPAWSNSKGRFEPVLDLQNTELRPEGAGQPRTAHAAFSGQTCTGTSVPPHVTQPVVSLNASGLRVLPSEPVIPAHRCEDP